jgi:hypothetical protein
MVDRGNTEVVLVVYQEEASGNITLLIDVVDHLGGYHHAWVLTVLKLGDVTDLVITFEFGKEVNLLGNGFDHA